MAKNKFATRALNSKDEPIFVTMELAVSTMEIEIKSFPIATKSDSEIEDLITKWNNGETIEYPEGTEEQKRAFTDESLLPDNIKVDGKSGAIRQLQNEWSYLILNTKLFEQFNTDLDIIKQKAGEIKAFSHELFDETKEFWEKILEFKKEREISQDKLNFFKEEINGVFDHLKHLKESMLKEKDEFSDKIKQEFTESISNIEAKLTESTVHFKTLMDELKEMQTKLKSSDVKRDIKNILFDQLQGTFEKVKTKRDEILGGAQNSRVSGLQTALERIQKTLDLDKKDLDYNVKKLKVVNNNLELQLREAKINVLKDRIASKEEKVADITKTLGKLTRKSTTKDHIVDEVKEKVTEIKEEATEIIETIGDAFTDIKEKFNKKLAEKAIDPLESEEESKPNDSKIDDHKES